MKNINICIHYPLLLFFICMTFSTCGAENNGDTNTTGRHDLMGVDNTILTEKVKSFLGTPIIDLLKKAESAKTYRIKGKKSQDQNNTLAGYPIIEAKRELTKDDLTILSNIAFDEKTYQFDSVKKCPFIPDYALVISPGEEELIILLSFNCDQWRFIYKNQNLLEDFDSKREELKNLVEG